MKRKQIIKELEELLREEAGFTLHPWGKGRASGIKTAIDYLKGFYDD